ncbi:MAG: DMT family transporter [Eggerthellaceae bacterium]|nr:DMT family transporter [Eggerthellaceae bacterium]
MRGMNNLQANICLLAVTFCWSCEVVIFSIIPDDVNPFATTCITSLIGAVLLGACFAKRIVTAFRQDRWLLIRRIAALSAMNTAYSVLFLVGLDYFNVSTGAFTISITAVVLPVMLLVMRRGVEVRTWISAICVLVGIIVVMLPAYEPSQIAGLAVMGAGCLIRALYIVKLNDYAKEHDPLTLATGMSGLNAVFAFVPWFIMQPTTFAALPWSNDLVAAYFIYGYFVIAFTISLNMLAQRRATPAQATIVYSTEIVFSTIWACCLPASIVDPVELSVPIVAGCALIIIGNLVEVLPVGSRKEKAESTPEVQAVADGALPGDDAQQDSIPPTQHPQAQAVSTQATDLVTRLLSRIPRPTARKVTLFAILLAVYLIIALPFKVLEVVPGFTDIRPVSMLYPVYGIFFGIPGCLANAVGNLIGDIVSDSLRWSSIAGFIANFTGPYLMYVFWTKLRKKPFDLRNGRVIGLFIVTVVIVACVESLLISPAVAFFYPDVDIALFAGTVIANDALFPTGFAIPFIIMLQEEIGFVPLTPKRQ